MKPLHAPLRRPAPSRTVKLVVLGAAVGFASLAQAVAPPADAPKPSAASSSAAAPFDLDDTARIEAGRKRFNKTCAGYCHGFEGKGGRAPDFKGQ